MGEQIAGGAARALVGLALLLGSASSGVADEIERLWMPETLPGFIRAMELGIAQNLTPLERDALARESHEALRETDPELYEKISRSFGRWTDEWVRRARRELESVPVKRLRRAEQAAADVDTRLGAYFETRGWDYRRPAVIFLPPRLMAEPGLPSIGARGLYVLYYPDVFFATLDGHVTLRHTLIHESLHFNKTGPGLGRTLAEGIAEVVATELALDWGMVDERALRQANSYPSELEIVEYIIQRIVERTGFERGRALEAMLQTYLTGDATELEAIFGADAWSRVVRASRTQHEVRKTVRRALGN